MATSLPAALFGSSASQSSALVEFRAGKCIREGTTVKPDTRKGLIYMNQGDDSLMHFYWKDRKTGSVEDDLIIFPEEADFIRVPQSPSRVYVLKFKSSSQKLFFWMQEPKADKDEELVRKVNQLINHPPGSEGGEDGDLMQVLRESAREAGSGTNFSAQLEQIRTVLAGISVSDREAESASELTGNLTPDIVAPILHNTEVSAVLFPNIEQRAHRSTDEIQTLINTSEFQQSIQSLSAALRSGQLAPVLEQLASGGSDVEALQTFLQALQSGMSQGEAMETD